MKGRLLAILVTLSLGFVSCKGKPEQGSSSAPPPAGAPGAPQDDLEKVRSENAALKETLGQKSALINEVQDELKALSETGRMVMEAREGLESGVKTREQGDVIREQIATAKRMLEEREKRIQALQVRLAGSEQQLKDVMDLLTKALVERADDIARLDEEVSKLKVEKAVAEQQRDEEKKGREEEAARRLQAEIELDTAYVAVGTEDELRAKGVLSVQKKGVLGIAKKVQVAPLKNFDAFQKISISKDQDIPIGKVKSFEAASAHDIKLLMTELRDGETILRVDDPRDFWKDKVLVIVVKR